MIRDSIYLAVEKSEGMVDANALNHTELVMELKRNSLIPELEGRGTYSRDVANGIDLQVVVDNFIEVLQADYPATSTIITLADTSTLLAGRELTFKDNLSKEYVRIVSVDSATQITITALINSYTQANEIVIYRSLINGLSVFADVTPTMTDYTIPSGEVTSIDDASGLAWKAFNDAFTSTAGNAWLTVGLGQVAESWIKYKFDVAVIIREYKLFGTDATGGRFPKNFTFEGSNNDSTWDVLDTVTNNPDFNTQPGDEIKGAVTGRKYITTNSTAYLYYRIHISEVGVNGNNADSRHTIYDIEFSNSNAYKDYDTRYKVTANKGLEQDYVITERRTNTSVGLESAIIVATSMSVDDTESYTDLDEQIDLEYPTTIGNDIVRRYKLISQIIGGENIFIRVTTNKNLITDVHTVINEYGNVVKLGG